MAVDNTGLYYTTIEGFINWISSNFAGMLADDVPNSYEASSDDQKNRLKEALLHGEGEVDGYLSIRGYKVPIDSSYERSINILKLYSYNIAVYELAGRRGLTKERYYKYEQIIRMLQDYRDGKKDLPDKPPFSETTKLASGASMQSVFASTDRSEANSI